MTLARWILCLLAVTALAQARADGGVRVLTTQITDAQKALVGEINTILEERGSALAGARLAAADAPPTDKPRVVVALGAEAARQATRLGNVPVLMALVTADAYPLLADTLSADAPRSAIYWAQPAQRQLAAIRAALPAARRIGLLWGPQSAVVYQEHLDAAKARGFEIVAREVGMNAAGLQPALADLLPKVDLLLSLPDTSIYNRETIPAILLGAYQRRVPVIGFSRAYTRAGALLSLHSDEGQTARAIAEALVTFERTGQFPPPQPVPGFTVSLNHHVARSLGLYLPEAEIIERQIAK